MWRRATPTAGPRSAMRRSCGITFDASATESPSASTEPTWVSASSPRSYPQRCLKSRLRPPSSQACKRGTRHAADSSFKACVRNDVGYAVSRRPQPPRQEGQQVLHQPCQRRRTAREVECNLNTRFKFPVTLALARGTHRVPNCLIDKSLSNNGLMPHCSCASVPGRGVCTYAITKPKINELYETPPYAVAPCELLKRFAAQPAD